MGFEVDPQQVRKLGQDAAGVAERVSLVAVPDFAALGRAMPGSGAAASSGVVRLTLESAKQGWQQNVQAWGGAMCTAAAEYIGADQDGASRLLQADSSVGGRGPR